MQCVLGGETRLSGHDLPTATATTPTLLVNLVARSIGSQPSHDSPSFGREGAEWRHITRSSLARLSFPSTCHLGSRIAREQRGNRSILLSGG